MVCKLKDKLTLLEVLKNNHLHSDHVVKARSFNLGFFSFFPG